MGRSMWFDFGLDKGMMNKKKWRWLFKIPGVSATGVNSLPPQKSARPDIKWKEMNIQHISEEVYFPAKPDWSIINITLYDLSFSSGSSWHPVFNWLLQMYDPQNDAKMYTPVENGFIQECTLELYDGCGTTIEKWLFEDAWPQTMNFHELDMGSNELVTCDIALRYARAYLPDATRSPMGS